MSSTSPEVVKWFTRARRFPQLIGRTPDGARIPGGPYTITQVVGAGSSLFVGTRTMGLWAHYGLLSNALTLLSITIAIVYGLGKIPVGSRNPLSVSAGTVRALFAPPAGRVAGRPVRFRRPQQVRHRMLVLHAAPAAPAAPAAGLAVPAEVPAVLPKPAATRSNDPRRRLTIRRRPATPAATAPAQAARAGQQPTPPQRTAPALTAVQSLLAQAATLPSARPVAVLPRPVGSSHRKDR